MSALDLHKWLLSTEELHLRREMLVATMRIEELNDAIVRLDREAAAPILRDIFEDIAATKRRR